MVAAGMITPDVAARGEFLTDYAFFQRAVSSDVRKVSRRLVPGEPFCDGLKRFEQADTELGGGRLMRSRQALHDLGSTGWLWRAIRPNERAELVELATGKDSLAEAVKAVAEVDLPYMCTW